MKFVSLVVALIATAAAAAAPTSFQTRSATPAVEVGDSDHAAVNYIVARGLFEESSFRARNFIGKSKFKGEASSKGKPSTNHSPGDHPYHPPNSDGRKKDVVKGAKKGTQH